MSKILGSIECGDWLICEISQTRVQLKSANPEAVLAARTRLAALKTTEKVLLEFLTVQQNMFDAARAARAARSKEQAADKVHGATQKAGSKSSTGHCSDRVHVAARM
jgi:hypothetical protein